MKTDGIIKRFNPQADMPEEESAIDEMVSARQL